MTLTELDAAARACGLRVRGAFHPEPGHALPKGCGTLILLGPDEPAFWPMFRTTPEIQDAEPHPLDRWSKRVIGALARNWGGQAIFPYDGPPYAPFLKWAVAGGCHPSPVGLLVHGEAGLFISFRGAVAVPQVMDLPAPAPSPCPACTTKPCETACPVDALRRGAPYDVPACQAHLRGPEGADCRQGGCLVRRACPISQRFGRHPAQSAFHMAAFVKD
ncbi:ferredoxin [Thalassococcus sp. BH17M4-6]|uniref:ferredoxin n=1 Tax=Thalassococcus sp. BH17M4-6 TaxID=3413148 RepID=UPI003BD1B92C